MAGSYDEYLRVLGQRGGSSNRKLGNRFDTSEIQVDPGAFVEEEPSAWKKAVGGLFSALNVVGGGVYAGVRNQAENLGLAEDDGRDFGETYRDALQGEGFGQWMAEAWDVDDTDSWWKRIGTGAAGFALDVGLDPTTYLTLGTGVLGKGAVKGLAKGAAKNGVDTLVQEGAEDTITRLARRHVERNYGDVVRGIGAEATDDELIERAGRQLAHDALEGAEKKGAQAITGELRDVKDVLLDGAEARLEFARREMEEVINAARTGGTGRTVARALETSFDNADLAKKVLQNFDREIRGGLRFGTKRFGFDLTKGGAFGAVARSFDAPLDALVMRQLRFRAAIGDSMAKFRGRSTNGKQYAENLDKLLKGAKAEGSLAEFAAKHSNEIDFFRSARVIDEMHGIIASNVSAVAKNSDIVLRQISESVDELGKLGVQRPVIDDVLYLAARGESYDDLLEGSSPEVIQRFEGLIAQQAKQREQLTNLLNDIAPMDAQEAVATFENRVLTAEAIQWMRANGKWRQASDPTASRTAFQDATGEFLGGAEVDELVDALPSPNEGWMSVRDINKAMRDQHSDVDFEFFMESPVDAAQALTAHVAVAHAHHRAIIHGVKEGLIRRSPAALDGLKLERRVEMMHNIENYMALTKQAPPKEVLDLMRIQVEGWNGGEVAAKVRDRAVKANIGNREWGVATDTLNDAVDELAAAERKLDGFVDELNRARADRSAVVKENTDQLLANQEARKQAGQTTARAANAGEQVADQNSDDIVKAITDESLTTNTVVTRNIAHNDEYRFQLIQDGDTSTLVLKYNDNGRWKTLDREKYSDPDALAARIDAEKGTQGFEFDVVVEKSDLEIPFDKAARSDARKALGAARTRVDDALDNRNAMRDQIPALKDKVNKARKSLKEAEARATKLNQRHLDAYDALKAAKEHQQRLIDKIDDVAANQFDDPFILNEMDKVGRLIVEGQTEEASALAGMVMSRVLRQMEKEVVQQTGGEVVVAPGIDFISQRAFQFVKDPELAVVMQAAKTSSGDNALKMVEEYFAQPHVQKLLDEAGGRQAVDQALETARDFTAKAQNARYFQEVAKAKPLALHGEKARLPRSFLSGDEAIYWGGGGMYEGLKNLFELKHVKDPTAFTEVHDAVLTLFKSYATVGRLGIGFHVRNAIGAGINNLAAGVDVRFHGPANRLAAAGKRAEEALADETFESAAARWAALRAKVNEFYDGPELGDYVGDVFEDAGDVWVYSMQRGVLDTRTADAVELRGVRARIQTHDGKIDPQELLEQEARQRYISNPTDANLKAWVEGPSAAAVKRTSVQTGWLANNALLRKQSELGEYVEHRFRLAAVLSGADRFGSREAGGMMSRAVHFDYQDLSDFERNVAKRVLPFYVWSRRNIPAQMRYTLNRPARMQNLTDLQDALAIALGDPSVDDGLAPDYLEAKGGFFGLVPGFLTPGGRAVMRLETPQLDLFEFLGEDGPMAGVQALAGGASPIVKGVNDIVKGYGGPGLDLDGFNSKTINDEGFDQGKLWRRSLKGLIPPVRAVEGLYNASVAVSGSDPLSAVPGLGEAETHKAWTQLMSDLVGAPISSMSDEQLTNSANWLDYQRRKKLDEALKNAGMPSSRSNSFKLDAYLEGDAILVEREDGEDDAAYRARALQAIYLNGVQRKD